MLLTGLAGEENTQDLYEFVSGEEVGTLRERNGIVKGIEKGVNDTLNYVGDTVTGKKGPEEIFSDLGQLGQGFYDDYIDPFAKEEQYKQENLFNGGLWTRSEEQSYAKGQNAFKKDMVVAEVAANFLSAGTGTAVMRTVKTADKLDGPDGKKKSGDHEGNGKGVLLPNSSIDDAMSAMLKDGKLKTAAKSFAESMIKLKNIIDAFLTRMKDYTDIRVGVMWTSPIDGGGISIPVVFIEKRNSHGNGNGGGGGGNHRRRKEEEEPEREERERKEREEKEREERERREREERERREQEQRDTEGTGEASKKFSEMSAEEQLAIAKHYAQRAPIEIPENANMKAKSMNAGYEQITYTWNDGTYKYEVRWHTRTPRAPIDQGNTWVIQRKVPGNGGQQPQTFYQIGENEWVEGYKWSNAIDARKAGTATPEQVRILDQGHWKE
ncbi:hypothetical protein [Brevibacillus brevis]|uniref:hypothetical protein n=1 Tax=Brevibacillus brevis TaxID=1393 RepID=UPI00115AADE5|nr:hypothetical protein [Lysinibacillus sp. SDF0063]TQR38693.1 hypothetical protein C7Y45_01090 [Lysinibacillus sp. SDF0063]